MPFFRALFRLLRAFLSFLTLIWGGLVDISFFSAEVNGGEKKVESSKFQIFQGSIRGKGQGREQHGSYQAYDDDPNAPKKLEIRRRILRSQRHAAAAAAESDEEDALEGRNRDPEECFKKEGRRDKVAVVGREEGEIRRRVSCRSRSRTGRRPATARSSAASRCGSGDRFARARARNVGGPGLRLDGSGQGILGEKCRRPHQAAGRRSGVDGARPV
jgi:hypothetical protein